jgi:hypothetical protein
MTRRGLSIGGSPASAAFADAVQMVGLSVLSRFGILMMCLIYH